MMNRQFCVTVLAAAGLAWGSVMARGEELARWNSEGASPLAASFAPAEKADGLQVADLTRGSGLVSSSGSPAGNTFAARGYDQKSYAAALSAEDYWETTLTPGGNFLSLDTLTCSFGGPKSGPMAWQWAYCVGGTGTWTPLGSVHVSTRTGSAYELEIVDLSAIPLTDQPVGLRLVAWNGETTATAWGNFGQKTNVLAIAGSLDSGGGAPVIRFTPASGSVDAGKTLEMAVSVVPSGSGVSAWNVEPAPAGTTALSGGKFTFTPAAADAEKRFTLSVTATNRQGATTGTASVMVNEAAPAGTLTLAFDNERQTSWSGAASVEIPAGSGISWKMENCMIGEDAEQDKTYGGAGKALRFAYDEPGAFQSLGKIVAVSKGTETVQTNGVASIGFWYGIYGEDVGEESAHPVRPVLVTELSDDGKLWVEVDRVSTEGSEEALQKREIEVGVETPVYFRIRVEGMAGSSRVNVDQVRIVPKVTDRDQRIRFLLEHNVTPGDEKTGIDSSSKDDWDGDNVSNFQEFRDKTNPYDKTDFKASSVGK